MPGVHERPQGMSIRTHAPLLAAAAAAAAFAIPAPTHAAASRTVTVDNFAFSPSSLSVRAGTTVTWRFQDSTRHNVTVRSGPSKFHSRDTRRGSYSRTLSRRGTYKLVCSIHPGMRQTIRVS
jgi:plastocyanin